jgi:hypothetical protein
MTHQNAAAAAAAAGVTTGVSAVTSGVTTVAAGVTTGVTAVGGAVMTVAEGAADLSKVRGAAAAATAAAAVPCGISGGSGCSTATCTYGSTHVGVFKCNFECSCLGLLSGLTGRLQRQKQQQ